MESERYLVRQCSEKDLDALASLYVEIYRETNPIERWTVESAKNFVTYFFHESRGLFYIVTFNDIIVGGIWCQVKPWWSGNKIYNLEAFVKKEARGQGLSKILLRKLLEEALSRCNAVTVEAITFNDRAFPLSYYDRISLKKDNQLVLLEGKVREILKNLET